MEYKFSPEEFSSLVSSSIHSPTAGSEDENSKAAQEPPTNLTAESQPDLDDLEDLDDLDDLDNLDNLDDLDNLDNLDDLDDLENPDSDEQSVAVHSVSDTEEPEELPEFLKFITLEQDESSKIPVYSCNLEIDKGDSAGEAISTIFQLVVDVLNKSFLTTADCKTYCDLWNVNFIANRVTTESAAFSRLAAMLFHIDFQSSAAAEKVMELGQASLLRTLEGYGRIISLKDVEIECGERAPDVVTEEEQLPSDVISISPDVGQQSAGDPSQVSDSDSDEFIDDGVDNQKIIEDRDDVDDKSKKLTKKAKLKLFAQMVYDHILTESAKDRFENVKAIKECHNSLVRFLCDSVIPPGEFMHFMLFLSQTREIVLDPALVKQCKAFNKYFLMLLSKNYEVSISPDAELHDSVFIIEANTGKVSPVFWDYVALNWRLFQLTMKTRSSIVFVDYLEKQLTLLQMQKGTKPRKMIFQPVSSPYTKFSNAFTEAAMNYLDTFNTSDGFKYNIQCDQVDFYYLIEKGYNVPVRYKTLSRQQRQSLNQLLAYASEYNQELFQVIAFGLLDGASRVNTCNLSKNSTIACYQIVAYCLSLLGNVSVSLSQSNLTSPVFVLSGDGIPNAGVELTISQIANNFRQIGEHVRMSSETSVSVMNGKLLINFKK